MQPSKALSFIVNSTCPRRLFARINNRTTFKASQPFKKLLGMVFPFPAMLHTITPLDPTTKEYPLASLPIQEVSDDWHLHTPQSSKTASTRRRKRKRTQSGPMATIICRLSTLQETSVHCIWACQQDIHSLRRSLPVNPLTTSLSMEIWPQCMPFSCDSFGCGCRTILVCGHPQSRQ